MAQPAAADRIRCSGCGQQFATDILPEHNLTCPIWAGDGEPDWGCRTCRLVWVGPRGKICGRCMSPEIVSFWPQSRS